MRAGRAAWTRVSISAADENDAWATRRFAALDRTIAAMARRGVHRTGQATDRGLSPRRSRSDPRARARADPRRGGGGARMKSESISMSSEGSLNHSSERNAGWARLRLGMTLAALVTLAFACTTTRKTTTPPQTQPTNQQGVASWYGQEFAGRTTANGEIFDPMLFTAAHRTLPFGTIVDVRNPKTNQTVRVRVNDRGPYIGNRTIDLSYAAAQQISLINPGSGDIEMTVARVGQAEHQPPAPYTAPIATAPPAPSMRLIC